ncbi:MAG: hypothetical protein ACI89L_002054 [Phycisphaerales bacterium]|jgi:hypothetical protein
MNDTHYQRLTRPALWCALLLQAIGLAAPAIGQTKVSIVKVSGAFGTEITKQPFVEALEQAGRAGVEVLVIVWDSQGGRADIGMTVGEAISAAPEGVRVVSVVDRAFGATVFGLAASDELLVLEGSHGKTVISFGIESEAPEGETDEQRTERLKGLESLRERSLEQVLTHASESGQAVGAYRAMIEPTATYTATVSGMRIPLDDSAEETLELSPVSAAESGLAGAVESVKPELIAAALGLESFELVRSPSTKYTVRQKTVTALMRRVVVLERQLLKEVDNVVDEWGRLEASIEYTEEANPLKFDYPSTQAGANRLLTGPAQIRWTTQTNEYGSRLTKLKRLMEKAARSKDQLNKLVLDRNAAIERVSESIGCPHRAKGITIDLTETDIEGLDQIWEWCLDEIEWCKRNQKRSLIRGG